MSPQTQQLIELSFTAASGLVAATLIPAVRRSIPRPLEVGLWIALFAAAGLLFVTSLDPRVTQANVSIAWGGVRLAETQAAFLLAGVGAWVAANRVEIVMWMALGAACAALTLALVHSHRASRTASRHVHLLEWFELPVGTAGRPRRVPAALAAVRSLAPAVRPVLSPATTAALRVKALVLMAMAHVATHVLGPGPARLRMVKLALGVGTSPQDAPESASPSPPQALGAWTSSAGKRSPHKHGRARRHGAARSQPAHAAGGAAAAGWRRLKR